MFLKGVMLWYGLESIVCYEILMLCYEISILCYAIVYVVKDKHSATVHNILNCINKTCSSFVFFCLVIWSLSSHSRIFHWYGDVTIAGEGLQILTYARHSWRIISDMGYTFIMVFSFVLNTHAFCWAFSSRAVNLWFKVCHSPAFQTISVWSVYQNINYSGSVLGNSIIRGKQNKMQRKRRTHIQGSWAENFQNLQFLSI